jgi:hypothetical protein
MTEVVVPPKIAIVAPCHIPPSEAWIASLKAESEAGGADVIIVDDSNGNLGPLPENWIILDYGKQMEFLGELYDSFAAMFHKCSACRVVGHLYAYANGYDVIIGLDSDCIVKRHFVRDHIQFLNKDYGCGWFNPIGYPHYSRGYPYSQRQWPIKANMGLWEHVLDINGKDRESNEPTEIKIAGSTVPAAPFPFSGMNWAITRDAILGFLFLPDFDDTDPQSEEVNEFRRIDDVWGGYIFQKLLRRLHWSSMLGYPFVFHDTVIVPEDDAHNEEAMYKYEDKFIAAVDEVCDMKALQGSNLTMADVMQDFILNWELAYHTEPFRPLDGVMKWWSAAIKKYA